MAQNRFNFSTICQTCLVVSIFMFVVPSEGGQKTIKILHMGKFDLAHVMPLITAIYRERKSANISFLFYTGSDLGVPYWIMFDAIDAAANLMNSFDIDAAVNPSLLS